MDTLNVTNKLVKIHTLSVSVHLFRAEKHKTELKAWASDLGDLNEWPWWLQRMYANEIIMGVTLRDQKGRKARFILQKTMYFKGDPNLVMGWKFVPESPTCRVQKVVIHNC